MSYDIYMRCYPQPDQNMSEEWEIPPFPDLARAKAFCQKLEDTYYSEDWIGHRLYRARFYPMEVKKETS